MVTFGNATTSILFASDLKILYQNRLVKVRYSTQCSLTRDGFIPLLLLSILTSVDLQQKLRIPCFSVEN
jgi:hypothetical protein